MAARDSDRTTAPPSDIAAISVRMQRNGVDAIGEPGIRDAVTQVLEHVLVHIDGHQLGTGQVARWAHVGPGVLSPYLTGRESALDLDDSLRNAVLAPCQQLLGQYRSAVGDQVHELGAGARCVFALPQPPDPTPR